MVWGKEERMRKKEKQREKRRSKTLPQEQERGLRAGKLVHSTFGPLMIRDEEAAGRISCSSFSLDSSSF